MFCGLHTEVRLLYPPIRPQLSGAHPLNHPDNSILNEKDDP